MGTQTEITVERDVAHIALQTGKGARLTRSALTAFGAALKQVLDDPDVQVIALSGGGGPFPSGVTVPAGGGDDRDNLLAELCETIEQAAKPVIAVLTGAVIGGGAEIALAAHYRLAHQDARIGFPHVRLGLVPSAGATQRLPRLGGGALSTRLLLGGQLVPLASGDARALVDFVFESSPEDGLRAFLAAEASPLPVRPTAQSRAGFADMGGFQAALTKARTAWKAAPEIAADKILSALEASFVLPMAAGLAFERAAAEDCAETDEARALAHAFQAEQRVSALTRRSDLPELRKLAVLGGGPYAGQIVVSALAHGAEVAWIIQSADQERDSVSAVRTRLGELAASGQLSPEKAQRCAGALRAGAAPELAEGAQLALRAARGQRGLELPPDVPVAHCLPGRDAGLGLQFAHPVYGAGLLEICLGPEASERDQALGLAVARLFGKVAVLQKTAEASLYHRLASTLWRAADALVDLGASPYEIDRAMQDWGLRQGPFARADTVGLDVIARQDRAEGARNWAGFLVEAGLSRFYTPAGEPDPKTRQLIDSARPGQAEGAPDASVPLLLGAMANEGAKALRAELVPRAGDIDVVSFATQLVPRKSGGIMHAIGAIGLLKVQRAMVALDHPDRQVWTPDPVFGDLIKYGRRFDDL